MDNFEISGINVKVRKLKSDDVDLLYDFFEKLSDRTKYFFHPHEFDYRSAKRIAGGDLDNPETRRYAAVINKKEKEEMIAYVFFWNWHQENPWLGIGVCDEWQGKGLGRGLLKLMREIAEKNNKKGIQLTTMKDNERAQALYKKTGFKIIGEKHGEHWMRLLF